MQHKHPLGDARQHDPALADLRSQLTAHENVLCTLVVDLNAQLRFATGLLALTDRRLLARSPDGRWLSWATRDDAGDPVPGLDLRHFDHAGVGTIELLAAADEG
ncbi:MAG: ABC transporter, partial [Polaromonas sp.]|nr:ABC transporter [Polaromonas sp.]